MATVIVLKAGSAKQLVEAKNLGELRQAQQASGMLATVNGDTVTDDSLELSEHDYVTFTEQVKGAAAKKGSKKPAAKKPAKKR
jgi:hypothetical protein